MRLFIAEKPSLARAIAAHLGQASRKGNGYIDCGQDIVTWCYGHLLALFDPEDYDSAYKKWDRATLPIVPGQWKHKPLVKSLEQLVVIGDLLQKADSVVNAGDPDREGQLLVDEVLEHFDYQGRVERIWLASLDDRSIKKALSSLTDNSKHASLRDAARARSQADWLVGLNATRALTILGRDVGHNDVLSLGRVQTPTLNLVVTRDRDIAAFVPRDYFVLHGQFDHLSGRFKAVFSPSDDQPGLDPDGRLTDAATASALAQSVIGKPGSILEVTREKKKKAPPLPHCLSSLQKAASAKLDMTAQQTLDAAQSLYEAKLTTYPRTDCRYLPVEQFDDAGRIMDALATVAGLEKTAGNADVKLKSGAWNTGKVTAHHAIIPTGEDPGNLAGRERDLYHLIAEAYCLQFYQPLQYESQKIRVTVENTLWEARGRTVLEPGWTSCAKDDDDENEKKEEEQFLPAVGKGDGVTCADVEKLAKKTTPPARWTEGTLIEAMANIHRFVADAAAKATLRENEGIGTEATRSNILETLKKRGYLQPRGKALVSTSLAGQVIDLTPVTLKDPVTTAQWESKLDAIAQGKYTLDEFMVEQISVLPDILAPLLSSSISGQKPAHPCPACGKAMRKMSGARGPFWSCVGYPDCSTTLPDDNGKPGKPREAPRDSGFKCPKCGGVLYNFSGTSKKTGKPYKALRCGKGKEECDGFFFFGRDGKPDFSAK
ncbi:MAG: DNA topoisomerase 3 [Desulfovibrio sp.]|jgi:DNA topoisomerase-3|nr:DNA topoisomerase 3 [Desulfovibrio sp.]